MAEYDDSERIAARRETIEEFLRGLKNDQHPVDCFYAPHEEVSRRYAQAITKKVQESKS